MKELLIIDYNNPEALIYNNGKDILKSISNYLEQNKEDAFGRTQFIDLDEDENRVLAIRYFRNDTERLKSNFSIDGYARIHKYKKTLLE